MRTLYNSFILLMHWISIFGDRLIHSELHNIHHNGNLKSAHSWKKAIVPKRRAHLMEMERELEMYHNNETHRPNMPQHDVSPDMIFKYPKSPDPPILPCSNNDSCGPSLQPIIVVPPPAPAPAPAIIQTGSGPAAAISQIMPIVPPPGKSPQKFLQKILEQRPITGLGGIINPASLAAMGGDMGGEGGPEGGGGGGASGPAPAGEHGLIGPMVGSGSGSGELAGTGIFHGADWNGDGAPSPGAKYAGSLTGPKAAYALGGAGGGASGVLSSGGGGTSGCGGDGVSATGCGGGGPLPGGPSEALAGLLNKMGGFCCGKGNSTKLCAALKQFNKNFKCYEKIMKNAGLVDEASQNTGPHSKPLQMVRGFLGAELFRLEDIIGNLNKKIDIIGDRVTKRPNQLARASLMAGMTSTFGDLQNTIEILNQKLDRRLKPEEYIVPSDPQYLEDQHMKVKELNILSKQLEQIGGAGWLGSKGFGLGIYRHEDDLRENALKAREKAQLKSTQRLEHLMHLVAERLVGLSQLMEDHPTVYEETQASEEDPVIRQAEEKLMYRQQVIQKQMALIQMSLHTLASSIAEMESDRNKVSASTLAKAPQFIKLVQAVLGKVAATFKGLSSHQNSAGDHLVQSFDQHVTNAGSLGDNLLSAGQTIDTKLQPLRMNDEGGVKGLVQDLASSYGRVATGNPFVGAPFGIVGANEPVPQESIPQLAASIASIPVAGEHLLDTNRITAGTSSGNAFAATAIDKYLEGNPANFGHAGFGVVSGNLGGSLGLGGIGGIDGGNALVLNETIRSKRYFRNPKWNRFRLKKLRH
ncbi:uncharacterized protein [Clytia hemisphaerica]|uniref:Uncharacterized protein n=1 Tax=Clytia hemisphaerica TaxID=252671 RepID=A0A7M5WLG7_9CNID